MSTPAPVTEAHLALLDRVSIALSRYDRAEAAQLIADSEAKACAELRGALALGQQNCDEVFEDLRNERDQLRAELATCKDASESLIESLRAEVERLRECCDQTSALCGKFITEEDGTDLIPNSARIANALARLEARAERAEAELATERARLDWLMAGGVCMVQHAGGFHVSRLHAPVSRAHIDAAMKEETK